MGRMFPVLGVPGVGAGSRAAAVNAYLLSLSPTLYLKFNEASGNVVNYGSDGGTGTVSGATQGQTGQLGPSEAYLFDGIDDVVTFANAALPATKALTTQRWVFLINASSLGEGTNGTFIFATGGPLLQFQSTNRLVAVINLDGTDATALTNVNQVDFLAAWTLLFVDYDDTNALGLGRRIRLMRATASSPTTLLTLATNTAGVGTVVAPSSAFTFGNNGSGSTSFAGLKDFAWMGNGQNGLWSPDLAPTDLTRCDVLRQKVFG